MDGLTPEQKKMLATYLSRKREDVIKDAYPKLQENDFTESLFGQGTYRDTGRKSSGMGESLDSLVGAPARQGISKLQDGEPWEAIKATLGSIGKDPQGAPTGKDIAARAGLSREDSIPLGGRTEMQRMMGLDEEDTLPPAMVSPAGVAGLGIEMAANLPMPVSPGIAGKIKSVGGGAADDVLKQVDSAEKAVALKGAEREQYLKALDETFGNRAKRSKDMGFGEKTYYHGTEGNIERFDPRYSKRDGEPAGFFTKDAEFADEFASGTHVGPDDIRNMREQPGFEKYEAGDGGNILPVRLKKGSVFDAERSRDRAALERRLTGNEVHELRNLADDGFDNWSEVEQVMPEIKKMGPDYVAVREGGHKNLAAMNGKDIRSTNAAFDPRFKDSDLLMAGHAGAGDSRLRALDKMLKDDNDELPED